MPDEFDSQQHISDQLAAGDQTEGPGIDEDAVFEPAELEQLVTMAARGTPGGFTDDEGDAFLDWARQIHVKSVILGLILEGRVFPNIHGMTDKDSKVILQDEEPRKGDTDGT
jgi:hypothetical protein